MLLTPLGDKVKKVDFTLPYLSNSSRIPKNILKIVLSLLLQ